MDYKELFVSARFFILGYRDDTMLQSSLCLAIDAVSHAAKDWCRLIDAEKNITLSNVQVAKPLFKIFVVNLCQLLLLRNQYHQNFR